jgi:hypothetical protein
MTTISLRNEEKCLASRAHAQEIVASLREDVSGNELAFDFSGIEVVTQSFFNELLMCLARRSFVLAEITFTGIETPAIEARLLQEIQRVTALLVSPE